MFHVTINVYFYSYSNLFFSQALFEKMWYSFGIFICIHLYCVNKLLISVEDSVKGQKL